MLHSLMCELYNPFRISVVLACERVLKVVKGLKLDVYSKTCYNYESCDLEA